MHLYASGLPKDEGPFPSAQIAEGRVLSWDPKTKENRILLGGAELRNLRVAAGVMLAVGTAAIVMLSGGTATVIAVVGGVTEKSAYNQLWGTRTASGYGDLISPAGWSPSVDPLVGPSVTLAIPADGGRVVAHWSIDSNVDGQAGVSGAVAGSRVRWLHAASGQSGVTTAARWTREGLAISDPTDRLAATGLAGFAVIAGLPAGDVEFTMQYDTGASNLVNIWGRSLSVRLSQ